MIKKYIFSLTMLSLFLDLTSSSLYAQDSLNYNKVMIIPFDPKLYFSDADHELSKYNNQNAEVIAYQFRTGLNLDVTVKVLSKYEAKPLLRDTSQKAIKDLQMIHKSIGYRYDTPTPLQGKKNGITAAKKKIKDQFTKEDTAALKVPRVIENTADTKYMNVTIANKEMLQYLSKDYGTDLFLFINQFEIVSLYEKCLDRAGGNYERDVKVHFSIFDKEANQLYGDVVIVHLPGGSNKLDEIISNSFPLISEHVAKQLPQKKEVKVN